MSFIKNLGEKIRNLMVGTPYNNINFEKNVNAEQPFIYLKKGDMSLPDFAFFTKNSAFMIVSDLLKDGIITKENKTRLDNQIRNSGLVGEDYLN